MSWSEPVFHRSLLGLVGFGAYNQLFHRFVNLLNCALVAVFDQILHAMDQVERLIAHVDDQVADLGFVFRFASQHFSLFHVIVLGRQDISLRFLLSVLCVQSRHPEHSL